MGFLDAVPAWTWVAILGIVVLAWWSARTSVARGNRRRARRAVVGEAAAERVLARWGYVVEDRQVTSRWALDVDGDAVDVWSRADLLVRRGRRRFVADVKTGERAPDPAWPATRRQLLEYRFAFDVDGVLLVDMERQIVVEVQFPGWVDGS